MKGVIVHYSSSHRRVEDVKEVHINPTEVPSYIAQGDFSPERPSIRRSYTITVLVNTGLAYKPKERKILTVKYKCTLPQFHDPASLA